MTFTLKQPVARKAKSQTVRLRHIDLRAMVVSRYIGETEKNIDRLFEAAEHEDVTLVFDEADALFGKQSGGEPTRRAAEHLLNRFAVYQGRARLSVGKEEALDPAFVRRLRAVVDFTQPSERDD